MDFFRPALKALLEERFHLKTHTEDRPTDAYTLGGGKTEDEKDGGSVDAHGMQGGSRTRRQGSDASRIRCSRD